MDRSSAGDSPPGQPTTNRSNSASATEGESNADLLSSQGTADNLGTDTLQGSTISDSSQGDPTDAGTEPVARADAQPPTGGGPTSEPPSPPVRIAWDWSGVIGTGQSLAVGDPGDGRNTPAAQVVSTQQPFNNLKLTTGNAVWPVDPNDTRLDLVPLTEPLGRLAPNYPSSWPENISGETAHASMANELTTLARAAGANDLVGVHSEVGENGQCIGFLQKNPTPQGLNGRAYEASLIETRAIARLAEARGLSFGVAAIVVTHGECDAGNPNYALQLRQLLDDYQQDLPAITGQAQAPLMILSQQNSVSDRSSSTLAQWRFGRDNPDVVCSGPKYQYAYPNDAIHLPVDSYQRLGEKYAQVYFERIVLGNDWQPLQPTGVQREGRSVRVAFHVPVPPLQWQEDFQRPHAEDPQWQAGRGFEVWSGTNRLTIDAVRLDGNSVVIDLAAVPPAQGLTVGYALTANPQAMSQPFSGTTRWGQLRDSDPFVGSVTAAPQPNFALAFELPVP